MKKKELYQTELLEYFEVKKKENKAYFEKLLSATSENLNKKETNQALTLISKNMRF